MSAIYHLGSELCSKTFIEIMTKKMVRIERVGALGMMGKVKWFNNEKGYGFIQCDDLDDIFVHYSAIVRTGYKTLEEGSTVNFSLVETPKGLQAIDVLEVKEVTV